MHKDVPEADLDVAIVGGGIAGLYCALRLVSGNPSMGRVQLFESSERVGGRIYTAFSAASPGMALELGAQTLLGNHVLIRQLLDELGISAVERPPEPESALVSLRGRARTNKQIRRARFFRPFDYGVSVRLQRKGPSAIMRKALAEIERRRLVDHSLAEGPLDARLLDVLSGEEIQYLCDRTGYGFWQEPLDAPAMLDWSTRELFENNRAILQVPLGMSAAIGKLVGAIEHRGGEVSTGQRLVALESNGMMPVTLRMRDNANRLQTLRARRVVLALPRRAICGIEGFSDRPAVRRLVEAIRGWPVLRGAVVYPTAWWQSLGFARGHTHTDLPVGRLDHHVTESPGRAENVSALTFYVDGKRGDYWRSRFAPLPANQWLDATHPLTAELHPVLAALYEPVIGKKLPSPLEAIVTDWQAAPFGGALHLWELNARPLDSLRLARQPVPSEPIHICGEAWSSRQGWIEGALETVEQTIPLLNSG